MPITVVENTVSQLSENYRKKPTKGLLLVKFTQSDGF